MRHITVRMAWHDNEWNGRVCSNPAQNSYCVGSHSLLSNRLARNRRLDKEAPGDVLDASMPEYLPPCYWSSAAFADHGTNVVHMHPFSQYQDSTRIEDSLPPNSVFTWPFRLSMTHSESVKKKHGRYFPDLGARAKRFRENVVPNESLVFFYLNYDNPVSADEYRYALVGCSVLTQMQESGHFEFDVKALDKLRSGDGMQNFPTLNWALRLSHAGADAAVRLPYQTYLQHVKEHPEDEAKLEEMRVLIEEPVLMPVFKYVSETIDHDQCLALLYKLRRAFLLVDEHGIASSGTALDTIESYIEQVWCARGLYPGLASVVSVLADLADGEPDKQGNRGAAVVATVQNGLKEDEDLLEKTFSLLQNKTPLTGLTPDQASALRDARAGIRDNKPLVPLLKKLSLFSLTTNQITRIVSPLSEKVHPFGGRQVSLSDLTANPYLLCECYVASTVDDQERIADLDRESLTDRDIGYFTIDIGMFPDSRYVERNDELQDLTVAGPQRLRAFAIEALRANELRGHSYASVDVLLQLAIAHPLFYKSSIALRDDHFLSEEAKQHFSERLFLKQVDGEYFFYLKETKDAEEIVRDFVTSAFGAVDHKINLSHLGPYLKKQAVALQAELSAFDEEGFLAERTHLMEGALQRSFFCITGRPGSGKTQALRAALDQLEAVGQRSVVLAPTGKAALRLNEGKGDRQWQAETIDHWIYRNGLGGGDGTCLSLKQLGRSDRFEHVDNLIIDEMSMVGLFHLALIFRALEVHQPGAVRRVILVGDENQLPPIACGRPFADVITFLQADSSREKQFLSRLATNCRQKHDPTVLEAAHLFAGKNRYHTELWDSLLSGGKVSDFLEVKYWESTAELGEMIRSVVDGLLATDVPDSAEKTSEQAFNELLGLFSNGYVPKNSADLIKLDRAQVLTPYRSDTSGALALSDGMRTTFRQEAWPDKKYKSTAFAHSDKIIRIKNWYGWNKEKQSKELRLSNGSIGILCNNKDGRYGYFPESKWRVSWEWMDEEDFELAYAITIHKAQGSEFNEVIVVIPERRALLSRELVYTALTRSKSRLVLLVERSARTNPLIIARQRSDLLSRNSSVFLEPSVGKRILEPEDGVRVQSKVEYVIYKALQAARERGELTFHYEAELSLTIEGKRLVVHPDFTVICGGRKFYWEHLGMLDRRDYASKWRSRVAGYRAEGLEDSLVTSDDLGGLSDAHVNQLIQDLINGSPSGDTNSIEFSNHHYRL